MIDLFLDRPKRGNPVPYRHTVRYFQFQSPAVFRKGEFFYQGAFSLGISGLYLELDLPFLRGRLNRLLDFLRCIGNQDLFFMLLPVEEIMIDNRCLPAVDVHFADDL